MSSPALLSIPFFTAADADANITVSTRLSIIFCLHRNFPSPLSSQLYITFFTVLLHCTSSPLLSIPVFNATAYHRLQRSCPAPTTPRCLFSVSAQLEAVSSAVFTPTAFHRLRHIHRNFLSTSLTTVYRPFSVFIPYRLYSAVFHLFSPQIIITFCTTNLHHLHHCSCSKPFSA